MTEFFRCGVCGARFDAEDEVRAHIAEPGAGGDTHDSQPWEVCDDDLCIVARRAQTDNEYGESLVPWSFFGSWRFSKDTDFSADENIGWEIRQLFRMGYVDVRVLHRRDAEHLRASTQPDATPPPASTTAPRAAPDSPAPPGPRRRG